jgi:hypothetical protein
MHALSWKQLQIVSTLQTYQQTRFAHAIKHASQGLATTNCELVPEAHLSSGLLTAAASMLLPDAAHITCQVLNRGLHELRAADWCTRLCFGANSMTHQLYSTGCWCLATHLKAHLSSGLLAAAASMLLPDADTAPAAAAAPTSSIMLDSCVVMAFT